MVEVWKVGPGIVSSKRNKEQMVLNILKESLNCLGLEVDYYVNRNLFSCLCYHYSVLLDGIRTKAGGSIHLMELFPPFCLHQTKLHSLHF